MIKSGNSSCFNISCYRSLIRKALDHGFDFKQFSDNKTVKEERPQIYLRHDIDFSLDRALSLARINAELGIVSNFFVMLSNPYYNLFDSRNKSIINEIVDMGNMLSLHYDEAQYHDRCFGLRLELKTFEHLTNISPQIISLHRPSKDFLANQWTKDIGIMTTYDAEHFKDIVYISDSAMSFDAARAWKVFEDSNQRTRVQLLLHPIWWFSEGSSTVNEVIDVIMQETQVSLSEWARVNCRTYQESGSANE